MYSPDESLTRFFFRSTMYRRPSIQRPMSPVENQPFLKSSLLMDERERALTTREHARARRTTVVLRGGDVRLIVELEVAARHVGPADKDFASRSLLVVRGVAHLRRVDELDLCER
jgi:hypothetical protein